MLLSLIIEPALLIEHKLILCAVDFAEPVHDSQVVFFLELNLVLDSKGINVILFQVEFVFFSKGI